MWNNFVSERFDVHFKKSEVKTSNETVYSLDESSYTHINYHSMKEALRQLTLVDKDFYRIVETGCSSHGTKSTLLWDKFVNFYDGEVVSVDLDKKAVEEASRMTSEKTRVVHGNSLDYLGSHESAIDFLYLDSYDVDFLNPRPSAEHHLLEFNKVKHLLHKDSLILIDDTPVSPLWLDNGIYNNIYMEYMESFDPNMAGKGSLVNLELEKMGAEKILHEYQILWKVVNPL